MPSQKSSEYKNLWLLQRGNYFDSRALRDDERLFDEHADNVAKKKSKLNFQNIDGLCFKILNNFTKNKNIILGLCYLKKYNPLMCLLIYEFNL
jgi:hypothetical protein